MYMTVRRYQMTGDSSEAMRRVREGFVPIVRAAAGFVAFYVVDTEDGALSSISVFDDKASAETAAKLAAAYVAENLAQFMILTATTAGNLPVAVPTP